MKDEIKLSLLTLKQLKLTPNDYVYLYCKYHDLELDLSMNFDNLEKRSYIKFEEDNEVILRIKAIKLFKTDKIPLKKEDFDAFVEKYRNIFPEGVKSGARPLRSDRVSCKKKLLKFQEMYPDYTQEEILDATKAYIDLKRKEAYKFTTCADYFIIKEGSSILASYVEDIRLRGLKKVNGTGKGQSEDI